MAKQKLVGQLIKSQEFRRIVNLMKNLRNPRKQILALTNQCLQSREYCYNYCPDCPAEQARQIHTSWNS